MTTDTPNSGTSENTDADARPLALDSGPAGPRRDELAGEPEEGELDDEWDEFDDEEDEDEIEEWDDEDLDDLDDDEDNE
jgi:hypothetical protein